MYHIATTMEISKAMEISMGLNFGYPMEFSMGHGNFHGGPYFKFQDHGNFHGVGNFHGGPYFTSDGRCGNTFKILCPNPL